MYNYADYNTLSKVGSTVKDVLESLRVGACNATKWFTANSMKANPEKFQVMVLNPMRQADQFPNIFNFDDFCLKRESTCKLLGVALDDGLHFDSHVDVICKKASRQLNALIRIKKNLDRKERFLLYKSFILSNFNHCRLVWHCVSVKLMRKMERVQERALRFLLSDSFACYEQLLIESGMSSLHLCRVRALATEIYKCMNEMIPSFMCNNFTRRESEYDLRDQNVVTLPNFKTITYGRRYFRYCGAHVSNSVPSQYKICSDIEKFKGMIKSGPGPSCDCVLCKAP